MELSDCGALMQVASWRKTLSLRNSEGMPTGILHGTDGAEIGLTTAEISFDDMAKLYLSVKPEYRKNGVWIMNDETALTLRTLKDAGGSYLWNHNSDTIFGNAPINLEMQGVFRSVTLSVGGCLCNLYL